MLPLVSIIIPAFNSEKYIEDTLDSVLNQKYVTWECLIVDDHSTDTTLDLAYALAKKDLRIKVYINPRKGACAARNYGLEQSTGTYIQFLDADDLLSPDKISSQIELANIHGDDIVYYGQWDRFTSSITEAKFLPKALDKDYDKPIDWLVQTWEGKGMAQTSVWLASRKLLDAAGVWNENLLINQDGEYFCRVLLESKGIKYTDKAKVYYRSGNATSISSSQKSKEKQSSLLDSYKSYQTNVLKVEDTQSIRKALGNNYLNFIYAYDRHSPELSKKAFDYFYALGIGKPWVVGGGTFKKIADFVGFKMALKIVKLMKV